LWAIVARLISLPAHSAEQEGSCQRHHSTLGGFFAAISRLALP